MALQLALRALSAQKGKIITTAYSYVATSHAIIWEQYEPVFIDVDSDSYCIDVDKIEARITDDTVAILATHVYGYPCDVDALTDLGSKYEITIIYDAAHAFGVRYRGASLLSYGDISAVSFHATKVYHTVEGGAVISHRKEVIEYVKLAKAFGHKGEDYSQVGINAKNSELHAAMGLCNLDHYRDWIAARKVRFDYYYEHLADLPARIRHPREAEGLEYNYSYFPILFESSEAMQECHDTLRAESIYPRRYFTPSLNELPFRSNDLACPVSERLSRQVLCLPFYPDLAFENMDRVVAGVRKSLGA